MVNYYHNIFLLYFKHKRYIINNMTNKDETHIYNPTIELIRLLISRNREDARQLKLTHFKNIKCNNDNNKSCIIPIYKIPDSREYIKDVKDSDLVVETLNCKYAIFIRDIYNITYKNLLERMESRYKINVGFFKE